MFESLGDLFCKNTIFLMIVLQILIFFILYFFVILPIKRRLFKYEKFLGNTLHEIKTPLGVAMINLQMCEFKNKNMHRIKSALRQIKITLEDFEYFVKNKNIVFENEIINLSKFLQDRINFQTLIANVKFVEFSCEISPNIEIFLSEIKLLRIIDNTLNNAIKFSKPNSKILISLQKDDNFAILKIQDFGQGIKNCDEIWDRYSQENLQDGSFGLGLNIVSQICKENKIFYKADSKINEGATFTYKFEIYKNKILDQI